MHERSKFAFDNRRSGEIDSMMVDTGLPYMGSHFTINNTITSTNNMYQN